MTIEQKNIFANNLKKYLKMRGKEKKDLVNDLNIPEATVDNWMRGVTYPRIDKVQMMADYLIVHRNTLTGESEFNLKEYF